MTQLGLGRANLSYASLLRHGGRDKNEAHYDTVAQRRRPLLGFLSLSWVSNFEPHPHAYLPKRPGTKRLTFWHLY